MDRLWSPWRYKYVSGNPPPDSCIFCEHARGEDRAGFIVDRGEHNFVLLNLYPYTNGHLMIAPYAHVSRLSGVEPAVTQEMMSLLRQGEEILQASYNCGGLNLGMNLGEAAGAGIEEHIHMHLLPRWYGDANFMTVVGDTRVHPELLEDTFAKLNGKFSAGRMS